ncbi:MAG: DNA primase [Ruminococcus sp.]|nr:DNA primase [Ruminococcus sp.]
MRENTNDVLKNGENVEVTASPEKKKERELPNWMLDKTTVNELIFSRMFLGQHPMKCIKGVFYDYDGVVDENELGNEIYNILMKAVWFGLPKKVSNIIDSLRHYCYSEPLPPDLNYIHLNNGKLDLNGNFYPYKEFCLNRLNIDYDPTIWQGAYYPERFLQFLYELLYPEDIAALQEYLGYLLIPSTKGQKMMFLIGQGGEGKSRIAVVLNDMFGKNMITGNIHRIEIDRFFRYNLKDRLLMVDDDMQMSALPSTGYLKNLVTAEIPIDVEAKGKQSEQALLYTRLLCFGNGNPKALYDRSKGFSRRMIILTTQTPPEKRVIDPHIADKFLAEKNKIFCWMYDGLLRLLANNYRFTISDRARQNVRETMQDNCNIMEFLEDTDRVMYGENYRVTSSKLYDCYTRWCEDNALTSLKRETFITWVKQNGEEFHIKYSTHIPNDGKNVRGFRGIGIKLMYMGQDV